MISILVFLLCFSCSNENDNYRTYFIIKNNNFYEDSTRFKLYLNSGEILDKNIERSNYADDFSLLRKKLNNAQNTLIAVIPKYDLYDTLIFNIEKVRTIEINMYYEPIIKEDGTDSVSDVLGNFPTVTLRELPMADHKDLDQMDFKKVH